MINPNSKVKFFHLRISLDHDENNQFALVRWEADESIKVGKDVVELIRLLSQDNTIKQAASKLRCTSQEVIDLLKYLSDCGFVKKIDNRRIKDTAEKIHPWLPRINRKYFRFFLSRPILYIGFIFIVSGVLIGITTPGYFPLYKDFFWTEDLLVVLLSLFIIDMILLFLHEGSHFIATKAIGGEALMRFSHRFVYIVAETESYHLAVLPKELRYFVYFAGMFTDFFIIAHIYWIFKVSDLYQINLGLWRNLMLAVVLVGIKSIVWQYNAYLETDMYNFLSDYLNQENLRVNTKKFLARKVQKWKVSILKPIKKIFLKIFLDKDVKETSEDLRLFHKNERRQLVVYSIILISGIIFTVLQYLVYIIPREFVFISLGFMELLKGISDRNIMQIIKTILLLFLVIYQYIVLFILIIKKRQKPSNV